jgi:hypothetical protein
LNLFTTPNPLLKQEGEFLNRAHQIFPLLKQEGEFLNVHIKYSPSCFRRGLGVVKRFDVL